MDQRRLVERAAGGDHDAFAQLVETSAARLDAVARLIVRDHELARDAVQDALIRVWRDLPRLRDPERFDGWLRKLLLNACLDAIRHRRRRPIEVDLTQTAAPPTADATGSVADRDELARAFEHLSPENRALVVAHYYLGVSMPESAALLGIPLGTAKSRLNRSLSTMRVALDAEAAVLQPIRDGWPA